MARLRHGAMTLLAASLASCGGGSDGQGEGENEENRASGARAAVAEGSFAVGGVSYPFRVVRCDLSGGAEDGMLLRGSGTTPDGRRLVVEVERMTDAVVWERASVYFGNLSEGDVREARMGMHADGRWFADEAGTTPASGPLIQVSGDELVVEAEFRLGRGAGSEPGLLRAACPG